MGNGISGARIKKGLGRTIPAHRISVSDALRSVIVQPDSLVEVADAVSFAAREGVVILPASGIGRPVPLKSWRIRLSLSRLSAITDYSPDSGLVCVQGGVKMGYLAEWLQEKGRCLAVTPDFAEEMELWEYLLSPHWGRFGPLFGSKWDQVFAVKAVLPSGRPYSNSLSPARATGPDFSQVILTAGGRFGIPLEIYLRVRKLPQRRIFLTFAFDSVSDAIQPAWTLARDITPAYLELGLNVSTDTAFPPEYMMMELWGEGRQLTAKRELVRKIVGNSGKFADVSHESVLTSAATGEAKPRDCADLFLHKNNLEGALAALEEACGTTGRMRVRGFTENQVCVSTQRNTLKLADLGTLGANPTFSSEHGAQLLDVVAKQLDPQGVFARIPQLWER
jgi:FAD/FMN-containing dehydrogenase